MKIGIFGGTFNPVHFGHLRPVEDVRIKFQLDKIYFVLANIPPHKSKEGLVSSKDRYQLLKIALKDNSCFIPSPVELRRKKRPSYTYDTIKYFKTKFRDEHILFILGSDAFIEFNSWFEYKKISETVDIVVMHRENFICEKNFLHDLGYKLKGKEWINRNSKKVHFCEVTRLDISSSKIRDMLIKGESVKYFLPEKCLKYIFKKKLYIEKRRDSE